MKKEKLLKSLESVGDLIRKLTKCANHLYEDRDNLRLDLRQTVGEFKSLAWSRFYYYKQFYYDVLFTPEYEQTEKLTDLVKDIKWGPDYFTRGLPEKGSRYWKVVGTLDKKVD